MFKRILIANRGEIAVRVFRACRELEIEPVVVYSQADREALHVQLAEQAYCIGPARSADSYLNVNAILTVAQAAGCDAIHPGYGFLSENADFADACEAAGITFIGPSGDVIRAMGNKAAARKLMQSAGVPVVPGSDGAVDTAEQAKALADSIGYPVLIKASAGGGGRGMRRVYEPEQLIPLFEEARSESLACFGSGEMYLEKLIVNPRHIEFQIMADGQGHVIQLGDRDCSIQRRNQKLLEESPSKALTPELRERMGAAAVAAARAAGYVNAGTIEFVLAPDGQFYFIEMNTRIPVSYTHLDVYKRQLFDREQNILGVAQKEFTQFYPREGWVEHDPMEIWSSQYGVMMEVIAQSGVNPAEIAAIGITNQRETTILWDRATGRPIYNAIVWQCRRTAELVDRLRAEGLEEHIRATTGPVSYTHLDVYKRQCVGCGKCAAVCVENNIRLRDGRPVWGDRCTHCMACICGCPAGAIEYGRASRGKPRYQCPEYREE